MIQLVRGFRDILPQQTPRWRAIEKTAISLFQDFGFKEIRIPILERTELFARSIGEDTDIVEKEMYTFPDRRGELITLRPEATASIVRSYIQHKLYAKDPVQKVYTTGPMFRRERPQKGRYRQFYQIDVEILGIKSAYADTLLIFMLITLLDRLDVSDAQAHINSLGCSACRPGFRAKLSEFISSRADVLCSDCNRRRERNPLRVLDCKVPSCREAMADAPSILDSLCSDCERHFKELTQSLTHLNVSYVIDKRIVRGLDYYTRTIFEIQTGSMGAQNAVVGGGRYDNLVKMLGGPDIPATGFAIGLDRLVEIAGSRLGTEQKQPRVFIAAIGEESIAKAFSWSCSLGLEGVCAELDLSGKSLKALMKRADKLGFEYVVIVGDNELRKRAVILRNMRTKAQDLIPIDGIVENLKKRLTT
ncbi:MAG: histidine--tRNA ligase [Deltaproteobacteria bacterium]|nr:histidine--tRNA ligase [Deltaproteobacteria bacterium]MBW2150808.1 histidine--tRNA ligase [Deltaproteobacteria bacterium]